MNTSISRNTQFMVKLALMSAVIVVMAFTPLGYIRTPGLSITLLTIPVAIGAMLLGPRGGAICGCVFGLTSLAQCFGLSAFGTMLMQINPVGTVFLCIVPRILEGFFCGLIFKLLHKAGAKNAAFNVAALSCPLLNTVFYMSALVLIFYKSDFIQGFVEKLGVSNPFLFVLAFVGMQGAIEAVVCCLVAGIVARLVFRGLKIN